MFWVFLLFALGAVLVAPTLVGYILLFGAGGIIVAWASARLLRLYVNQVRKHGLYWLFLSVIICCVIVEAIYYAGVWAIEAFRAVRIHFGSTTLSVLGAAVALGVGSWWQERRTH
jgi:hypothetical protein